MKVTVVPAQVTTVEDRIAGSLGLSQIVLLALPVFGGSALYVILPPIMHSALYKLIFIGLLFILCGLLAIRIKGKIVLLWLITLLRYNLRPRYYVYDKRTLHGREMYRNAVVDEIEEVPAITTSKLRETSALSPAEMIELSSLIENPAANVAFETNKKGNLYVRITEIKQES